MKSWFILRILIGKNPEHIHNNHQLGGATLVCVLSNHKDLVWHEVLKFALTGNVHALIEKWTIRDTTKLFCKNSAKIIKKSALSHKAKLIHVIIRALGWGLLSHLPYVPNLGPSEPWSRHYQRDHQDRLMQWNLAIWNHLKDCLCPKCTDLLFIYYKVLIRSTCWFIISILLIRLTLFTVGCVIFTCSRCSPSVRITA